jgi:putative nucleotidyltransferase with HDIG domain
MPQSILSTTSRETIESLSLLAYTAEVAEWDNRAHLRRIKAYAFTLFTALGLSKADAELLALACVLHDVGKAATPDELLKRQGSYTPAEWQVMERHTIDGEKMLRDASSPILRAGAVIALTHHERWDGSGYPNHLSGEAIPLSGRVCAVVDVYDALTPARIYKEPGDCEEAYDLIRRSGDKLFDPAVVRAFVNSRSEFLSLYKTRGDLSPR